MNCSRFVNILFAFFLLSYSAKTQIVLEHATSDVICNGASNISITFSLSGGTPPYNYGWKRVNNNFIFVQGTLDTDGQNATIGGNFYATSYIIEVVDAAGLAFIDTVTISEPPPLLISEIIYENPSCFNACDGSISLSAEGGVGNITITWADIEAVTPNRDELCEGAYFYFLLDEVGCTQKGIIDLFAPPPITLTATIESPSCLGLENGRIYLGEIEGGTPPYSFNWEDNNQENNATELSPGIHYVSIEDAHHCLLDTNFIIPPGDELLPNVQVNYGCGDGSIVANALPIHAQEPYEMTWSTGATTPLLFGLSAGFYSLSITDAIGCEGEEDFTVDFVPPLILNGQIKPVSCPNAQDGGVVIDVIGGIEPFVFSWSNDTNNQDLENVSGGDYTINLSANGCGINQSFYIPEPTPLEAVFIFESTVNGFISATALVSGGNAPYFFSWSNGDTEATANNLLATDIYTLTITDSNNCTTIAEFNGATTATQTINFLSDIHFYPNPTSGKLWINQADYSPLKESIHIFNSKGQEVFFDYTFSNTSIELAINHLSAGVYYISILSEKKRRLAKFVKL